MSFKQLDNEPQEAGVYPTVNFVVPFTLLARTRNSSAHVQSNTEILLSELVSHEDQLHKRTSKTELDVYFKKCARRRKIVCSIGMLVLQRLGSLQLLPATPIKNVSGNMGSESWEDQTEWDDPKRKPYKKFGKHQKSTYIVICIEVGTPSGTGSRFQNLETVLSKLHLLWPLTARSNPVLLTVPLFENKDLIEIIKF